MRVHEAVPVGSTLVCNARLAQRSSRGGWVVTALESEITLEGRTVLTTRATVMSPRGGIVNAPDVAQVTRDLTQPMLNAYADA